MQRMSCQEDIGQLRFAEALLTNGPNREMTTASILEYSYFLGGVRIAGKPRLFFFNIYGTHRLFIYDVSNHQWHESHRSLYKTILQLLGEHYTLSDIHTEESYISETAFRRFDWKKLYWNFSKIVITASAK
jgi:hypothetical protein